MSYQIVPLPIMPPTVNRYMSVRQWIKMFSLFEKGDGHFCWQGQSRDEWGAKVVTVHSRQRPIYNVSQSFWSILYFSSHFVLNKWRLTKTALCALGGFHLQLLVFLFVAFTNLFGCTEMRWMFISSTAICNVLPFYTSSQNSNLLYSEVDFLKHCW